VDEDGDAADGSGWWHYYIVLGTLRFELNRSLSRWERIRCWLSPFVYETKMEIPNNLKAQT
jgi:hypothetical protein